MLQRNNHKKYNKMYQYAYMHRYNIVAQRYEYTLNEIIIKKTH